MKANQIKKLQREMVYERPTVDMLIRSIDAELLEILKKQKNVRDWTWSNLFAEMALEWLKKSK